MAQGVSKALGKIGATSRLFEGGVKTGEGAIQTTSITGDKLIQNFMKGGNKVLTTGGAFLTGKGDKAEIFGGIAHELNHYLQWKEVVLNLDMDNPKWVELISTLQQFDGAQKNIEYLMEKYPDKRICSW